MEESTARSCSKKSCDFSFLRVIKAGFFAAILTNILMIFQGNNALFYFGTLFSGTEIDPKVIYLVGVVVAIVLGIILALIYALILAPWGFFNDLVKAIIFAIILTGASYYASPYLSQFASKITGRSSLAAQGSEIASKEEVDVKAVAADLIVGKAEKSLVITFTNSLIFTLMVVVLYRRKFCRIEEKLIKN